MRASRRQPPAAANGSQFDSERARHAGPFCFAILRRVGRLKIALIIGLVIALAGCGSSGKTIPTDELSKLVLQPTDLPPGFAAFYQGPQLSADQTGPQSDPKRFGRTGGWIARYNRGGSPKTRGPLVVASRVDLFKDSGGAKRDFQLYPAQLDQVGAKKVDVESLGDQGFGVVALRTGAVDVRSYAIAWREHNATAEVELNGFKLTLTEALALARKQELRLRNALR
jgi:hypothetical protein